MKCKNCGATIHYDPASQLIVCDSCGTKYKPKERTTQQSDFAEESAYYLYTCSSCGAELAGTYDTSAVGFCSYCGGQSIIRSRIEGIKSPRYIVPFSKTKEECCNEYMDVIKKLPLVPKDLKERDHISEIRGIYVPYYIYHTNTEGLVKLVGNRTTGSKTEVYHLDANFKGSVDVPVDASIQIDDDIGIKLLPNDENDVVEFDEDYMAGYYTEVPDVDPSVYYKDVSDTAESSIVDIFNTKGVDKLTYKDRSPVQAKTDVLKPFITLIPMYFLTYRKNDRVCYAMFGGRKDANAKEMYCTVPISLKKYLLTSFIVSIGLTLLLSLNPNIITHSVVMNILVLIANICIWIIYFSIREQAKRLDKMGKTAFDKKKRLGKKGIENLFTWVFVALFVGGSNLLIPIFAIFIGFKTGIAAIVLWMVSIIPLCLGIHKALNYNGQIKIRYLITLFVITLPASVFTYISTNIYISDTYYYIFMTIISIVTLFGILGIYQQYNQECTRAIPQFTREGGYNSAKDM